MPTIAFISPKGGAGKTTAALVLALGLRDRGARVAMIDSDPNRPLVEWAKLTPTPTRLSVHPAPTAHDVRDAWAEARRQDPDWIILDTEGSIRGAMVFPIVRPDLLVTPLGGSPLEVAQALKAAEIVGGFGNRTGANTLHRCLLTRIPAAIRTKSLRKVVEQLRQNAVELIPTALLEKEAFRALFTYSGGFDGLLAERVSGVQAARENAEAYVDAVLETLRAKAPLPRG